MITEAVLNFFSSIIGTLLGLLPDWEPPDLTGALSAIAPLWGYLSWANKYAPLVEIGALMATLLGYWVGLYLLRFTIWLLTKAHVLGGD